MTSSASTPAFTGGMISAILCHWQGQGSWLTGKAILLGFPSELVSRRINIVNDYTNKTLTLRRDPLEPTSRCRAHNGHLCSELLSTPDSPEEYSELQNTLMEGKAKPKTFKSKEAVSAFPTDEGIIYLGNDQG